MRLPGVLLVLAAIALPVAAASPVDGYVDAALAEVHAAEAQATATVVEALGWLDPPQEEEEPAPEESAPASGEHEDGDGAPHQAPPAPRERDGGLDGTIPAPASRLVPIPVSDIAGPLPRIDVTRLASTLQDAAPVAPAPAPARASEPAPEALAPASVSADAAPIGIGADLVIAGVVATAGAAAATQANGIPVWDRLRKIGFLALLYSRIAKERLLDHGSREALLAAIRAKPGLAVADLATTSGIPRNTVTYHLRVLEREGLVSSTRNGRNRLFFAPGSLPQRASADALATLRHETTLAVARKIGAMPGVDQKGICESLGISASLAHWHADRLVATGLIDKRREGRNVRYYPGAAYGIVDARAA